eukprot:TRINITY_DN35794_c0_g1_i1.p1 TRINITY_DN35794_c0_g1~~TRINITY_DN35794_c0_g1_i1.p1  ORF type:complete len:126 (-),score=30.57 TRINITY_DN35794_c0_g1_i1:89-466(-)
MRCLWAVVLVATFVLVVANDDEDPKRHFIAKTYGCTNKVWACISAVMGQCADGGLFSNLDKECEEMCKAFKKIPNIGPIYNLYDSIRQVDYELDSDMQTAVVGPKAFCEGLFKTSGGHADPAALL